jgi:hypothetical protein
MNVKSGCEKAETGRRRDAALRRQTHMNMSNTPFTNIETCDGVAKPQTAGATPTRLHYAYGVIVAILRTAS